MRRLFWLLAACLIFAGSGFGDSITDSGTLPLATGLTSTATLQLNTTANTFTLDFNIANTSATTATINSFALQLFGGPSANIGVTSASLPSGWRFFGNEKINNNGTTGCTGNAHPGWLCADDNLTSLAAPASIASGGQIDFTFVGSYAGQLVPLDLMANGLTNINNSNSKWAVSQGMNTTVSQVPEPGSLLLLGTGLFGLAAGVRRKIKR